MDALPIQELNRFAHASENDGIMHACGHDGHITMALLASRYLAETRAFNGRVQFIFQPCEEQDGGASDMVEDGLFERFPTDFIIGCHNWPDLPAGLFGFSDQALMASCNAFKIQVHGRGAHGAMPNNAIDPLFVALQIANSLQGIITRIKRPIDPAVLSICKLQAGQKSRDVLAAQTGDSARNIQRYIRLTELIPELLDMVDEKKIAFNPAYELSFLKKEEQTQLLDAMDSEQATPSLSQAQRLKKYSQEGHLTLDMMRVIMGEEKKSDLDKITFTSDTLRKYFPRSYTPARMQETIIKLLEAWQRKRQRDQER